MFSDSEDEDFYSSENNKSKCVSSNHHIDQELLEETHVIYDEMKEYIDSKALPILNNSKTKHHLYNFIKYN